VTRRASTHDLAVRAVVPHAARFSRGKRQGSTFFGSEESGISGRMKNSDQRLLRSLSLSSLPVASGVAPRPSAVLAALVVAVAPLALGCGSSQPRTPAPVPTPVASDATSTKKTEVLEADTKVTTASGAHFEAPKGWQLTTMKDRHVLESPERDLRVAFLEVEGAADATGAIATAWKRVDPTFSRASKQVVTPPARDGWESITQVTYEVGGESRLVTAIARRKGTTHHVALVDGPLAAVDRRGAQLMTAIGTYKAAGIEDESFAGRAAQPLDEARQKALEAFVTESLAKTGVPGAAIAVVQGGKVVYEKGFGVRELGKGAKAGPPVTPNTLFMIGSTTKSLTTLLMAKLVDEGRFTWDTPVTEVLPSFALGDAEITKKVAMRHTVCACTGLPRQDMEFIFEYAGVTPEQRLAALKTMKPTTGFGETFQYSNTMVAAGGYAAARTLDPKRELGAAYDEAMKARVFGPIGMKSTTLSFAQAKAREHAEPHAQGISLEYAPVPLSIEEGVVALRPAGAAWSNVRDMARYMTVELNKGKDDKGRELFSEKNILARREPQVKITDKRSYGLGLFTGEDAGVALVEHGGNNIGFTSDMFMLPEHGVGVVFLTNGGNANALRGSVRRRVLELLFDGKEEAAARLDFAVSREKQVVADELKKITLQPEGEWVTSWSGTYQNPSLGKLVVKMDKARAILDAGEWKTAIGTMKEADGSMKVVITEAPFLGLGLVPTAIGDKKALKLEAGQQTYVFELVSSGAAPAPSPAAAPSGALAGEASSAAAKEKPSTKEPIEASKVP
jgi:CubicO group peptidase (beta-lactamase class C family)